MALEKIIYSKFERWLRQQMFQFADDHGGLKRLIVSHLSLGKATSILGRVKVGPHIGPENLDELITDVESVLETDVDGMGNLQKYQIQPEFTDGAIEGRFILRLTSVTDNDNGDALDSEPPNKTGLTSQLMRHLEVTQKTSFAMLSGVVQMQNRTIAGLTEQNEHMQSKHIELIETLESLKSEHNDRQLAADEQQFKLKLKQSVADKMMLLAPIAVNHLVGKKLLKESTTTTEQMIAALMKTMTKDQFPKLLEVLTSEQQMVFFKVYENLRDKFEPDEPEKKNGKSDEM